MRQETAGEGKQATSSAPAKAAEKQKDKDQTGDTAPVPVPDHDVFNPPAEAEGEFTHAGQHRGRARLCQSR
jgi:hypothetical protein